MASPLDKFLGAPQAPAPTTAGIASGTVKPTTSPLDRFLGDVPNNAALAIEAAVDLNPDQVIKQRNAAATLGLPEDAAEVDPDMVLREARKAEINRIVAKYKITSDWLSDPGNAKIAHDSVEKLTSLEEVGKFAGNSLKRGLLRAEAAVETARGEGAAYQARLQKQSFGDILEEVSREGTGLSPNFDGRKQIYTPDIIAVAAHRWLTSRTQLRDPEQDAIQSFRKAGELAQKASELELDPRAKALLEKMQKAQGLTAKLGVLAEDPAGSSLLGLQIAGEFIPQLTLAAGVTAVSRNPAAGVAALGGGSAATERYASAQDFLQERGVDFTNSTQMAATIYDKKLMDEAAKFGFTRASIIGAFDITTAGLATKTFGGVLTNLATQTGVQVTGGAGGEAVAQLATVGDLDLDDIILEGLGEMVSTPADIAAVGGSFFKKSKEHSEAVTRKKVMDDFQKEVVSSPLAERAPDKAAEHAAKVLSELTDIKEVYIPADKFAELVGESGQFLDDLGLTREQFDFMAQIGADVAVSANTLSRILVDKASYDKVSSHIRYDESQLTEFESLDELVASEISQVASEEEAPRSEAETHVILAEEEIGLNGLFQNAKDAGMTEAQYASYLKALASSREQAVKLQEQKLLKQEQRKLTEEWKKERERVEAVARESSRQLPVYAALENIQRDRLDRDAVLKLLDNDQRLLEKLPKQSNGRTIFTPKNQAGIDPDTYAEIHGFEDGLSMLVAMMDAQPFEDFVQNTVERTMAETHSNLQNRMQAVAEGIKSLQNDRSADLLAYELNWLRKAKKAGLVRTSVVRAEAKRRLMEHTMKDIRPSSYLATERREARKAASLLRKDDRTGAAQAKFRQLMNYHFAWQAVTLRDKARRAEKFFRKMLKKPKPGSPLPPAYRKQITELLADYAENGAGSMRAGDFFRLYDQVRAIHHVGINENKLLKEGEKQTRKEAIGDIIDAIESNLAPRGDQFEKASKLGAVPAALHDIALDLLFNADTVLREIDGFKDLGVAYQHIKGRYDTAYTEGYHPGQIGYIRERKKQSQEINKLFGVFSKRELTRMSRREQIPGVGRKLSQNQRLAVMLNMGNEGNRRALLEASRNAFTESELQAIASHASKKEWDFVQSVWDYLDTLWPRIQKATERRTNVTPEKVEAITVDTPHGPYRGGYYPLRYDTKNGPGFQHQSLEEITSEMRSGTFVASHTNRGHTESRTASGGRQVMLDLFVLNSHVDRVIYDLEVGDAVNDIYKILYSNELRGAFDSIGRKTQWQALDSWFRDAIIDQRFSDHLMERWLRWARSGFTVTKLGYNMGTAALQFLGTFQTAVQIGKMNTLRGMWKVMSSPQVGENNIYSYVASQTGFMEERQETFNKDIIEAQRHLQQTFADRILPGQMAEFMRVGSFYAIKKAQRFVDTVTWLGAHQAEMERSGNTLLAAQYADRMVARSQGSGNFAERTPLERGTAGNIHQTEFIRLWTALGSFFFAKANIAYERVKKTEIRGKSKFQQASAIVNLTTDLLLLYTIESYLSWVLYSIARGVHPDDEDDTLPEAFLKHTFSPLLAGLPFIRDIAAEAKGFTGAGAILGLATDVGKVANAVSAGDFDEKFLKSANNIGGTLLHYPAGQINKTGSAVVDALDGEDTELLEFIFGPRFDE